MAWSKLAKHLQEIAEGRPEPARDILSSGQFSGSIADRPEKKQHHESERSIPDLHIHRNRGFWVGILLNDGSEVAVRAKSLRELKNAAVDVLGAADDQGDGSVSEDQFFHIRFDQPRQTLLDAMRASKEDAERAVLHARKAQRDAVNALRKQGITMQDIADMMGITKSRVSQLANGK